MELEAGKFYQTRVGLKARVYMVYSDNLNSNYVVHGAISLNSLWVVSSWKRNGTYDAGSSNDFDIVSEWAEAPVVCWDRFPSHIKYLAQDKRGNWCGYMRKPFLATEDFCASSGRYEHVVSVFNDDKPSFSGDWKKSLCERPE